VTSTTADHSLRETHDDAARGRRADKPSRIPARGWRDIVVRTWRGISNDNVTLASAGLAF
jgi:membrane protein